MLQSRKFCVACKKKRNIENLKVFREKPIILKTYICTDKKKCYNYQLRKKKRKIK